MEKLVMKKDETQDDLESSFLEWLKEQSADKLIENTGDFMLDNWMNLQYLSISDASVKFMFREFGTQGVTDMVKNIKEKDLDVKFDDTILGGDVASKESSKLNSVFHKFYYLAVLKLFNTQSKNGYYVYNHYIKQEEM